MTKLIEIMREIRAYLARPDNEFIRSTWDGADVALNEVDAVIDGLEREDPNARKRAQLLFGPTGNIQEVSIPSGWGHEFLNVSARFDEALEKSQ